MAKPTKFARAVYQNEDGGPAGRRVGRAHVSPRPYKTLGYPVMPLLFILVAAWLVINTIKTNPVESAIGLILIALGLPVYVFFKRKQARTVNEEPAAMAQRQS